MITYRKPIFLKQKHCSYISTLLLNNKLNKFNNIFKLKTKSIMSISQNTDKSSEGEEVKIKVPWGHVAGKWWGPKDVRPMLGLHGWQDNAGTFDTLAPLLPADVSLLAIDFPGHGFSSHLPVGMFYTHLTYLTVCRYIMLEYSWEKISIIGHSLGSLIGFLHASVYPDETDMLIQIDALKPRVVPLEEIFSNLQNSINSLVVHERRLSIKSEPPSYTHDELVELLYNGTSKSINRECCKYILARNIKKSTLYSNKYTITRDSRVKSFTQEPMSQEFTVMMAKRIKCPHLFVKASESPLFEKKENYEETLSVLKEKPDFVFHSVEGKHHVHLTNPSIVIEYIKDFIEKYHKRANHTSKL